MNILHRGFSLIELMIVITIVSALVALAMPAYSDMTIRTRVAEGLSLAGSLKSAVATSCQSNPNAAVGPLWKTGFKVRSKYTRRVDAHDNFTCQYPLVRILTTNTGAAIDPEIYLQGLMQDGSISWTCHLRKGEARHVPAECRDSWRRPRPEVEDPEDDV